MVASRARESWSSLLGDRPRLVLHDVLVHRRHQPPGRLQRARELELLELRVEIRNGLLRQLGRSPHPPAVRSLSEGYGTSPSK